MKKTLNNSPRHGIGEALAALAIVGGSVLAAAPTLAANTNVNLTPTNQFDQANVTVQEGDTVTFTWQGGFHDVTFADGMSSGAPVGIDGTTFSRTFDAAGTYEFVCSVHASAGMAGTIVVEAAGSTQTTAAPAADATATTTAAPAAAATTTAPAAGSAPTTATPAAAPRSGSPSAQPFTGPEPSLLPAAGIALAIGGIAIRLRLRRAG